ncbi:hypothetical protein [Neptuniibacter sp. QD37_11]|uniref:hypothetical protein n=1 Tax=Neptuniibacter sp. QD37_11 TaxID=3398209 RepID=UPI0039F58AA7
MILHIGRLGYLIAAIVLILIFGMMGIAYIAKTKPHQTINVIHEYKGDQVFTQRSPETLCSEIAETFSAERISNQSKYLHCKLESTYVDVDGEEYFPQFMITSNGGAILGLVFDFPSSISESEYNNMVRVAKSLYQFATLEPIPADYLKSVTKGDESDVELPTLKMYSKFKKTSESYNFVIVKRL